MAASHPHNPPSPLEHQHSDGGIRKRVCKACDRCRLKKSKCDGSSPCSRCKADNAICVFGERKKSHDKVYPKGYVEMLEQQQGQLVAGLQELYKRTIKGEGWPGSPLTEHNHGHPYIHDILERLGALKHDVHGDSEVFEEDTNAIQQRLISNGAGLMQRTDSMDGSESPRSSVFDHVPPHRSSFASNMPMNGNFPPTPPENNLLNYRPQQQQQQQQQNVGSFNMPHGRSHTLPVSMPQSMFQQQSWPVTNDPTVCQSELPTPLPLATPLTESFNTPQYFTDPTGMGTIDPNCLPLWSDDDILQRYLEGATA